MKKIALVCLLFLVVYSFTKDKKSIDDNIKDQQSNNKYCYVNGFSGLT